MTSRNGRWYDKSCHIKHVQLNKWWSFIPKQKQTDAYILMQLEWNIIYPWQTLRPLTPILIFQIWPLFRGKRWAGDLRKPLIIWCFEYRWFEKRGNVRGIQKTVVYLASLGRLIVPHGDYLLVGIRTVESVCQLYYDCHRLDFIVVNVWFIERIVCHWILKSINFPVLHSAVLIP